MSRVKPIYWPNPAFGYLLLQACTPKWNITTEYFSLVLLVSTEYLACISSCNSFFLKIGTSKKSNFRVQQLFSSQNQRGCTFKEKQDQIYWTSKIFGPNITTSSTLHEEIIQTAFSFMFKTKKIYYFQEFSRQNKDWTFLNINKSVGLMWCLTTTSSAH